MRVHVASNRHAPVGDDVVSSVGHGGMFEADFSAPRGHDLTRRTRSGLRVRAPVLGRDGIAIGAAEGAGARAKNIAAGGALV